MEARKSSGRWNLMEKEDEARNKIMEVGWSDGNGGGEVLSGCSVWVSDRWSG